MKMATLADLQESVRDSSAFGGLEDYLAISLAFLRFVKGARPTRIVSPTDPNYFFFQYGPGHGHRITRPLKWDPEKEEIIGDPEAARWLDRAKREPWGLS